MTRYQPVDNGYQILGSRELFNRTLYGSHANDNLPERYFTFAGDLPLIMGSVTDWSKNSWGNYAKSGVLFSGLTLTPGVKMPLFCSDDVDTGSHWFHNSEDIIAVFRNGWMEYEFRQFSPWFPDVKVNISVFPLLPEDGFLVHYRIRTDQRVIFCAGFGGITDFINRFEHPQIQARNFSASDCESNTVKCGRNRALLKGTSRNAMWIGASFPMTVEAGDALSLQDCAPGMFLKNKPSEPTRQVVKMFAEIGPGDTLDGFLVAIRNQDESVLDKWLNCDAPIKYLKQQIHLKQSVVTVHTPDAMLNLTVPPTVLAMDASWHKNTFYHGAHAYHAPFLGWRGWYGPTVIGWHDRVATAVKAHFSEIVREAPGKETVWYDGKDRPDLDHEGTQYHQIRNSTGSIPALLGRNDIYNMQEVAVDMLLHHLEWTADLKLARERFDDIKGILDWEERILDPDKDGLYQNFLNTWISDGHSYNGGGCAQASAYNYFANLMMVKIAKKLGFPDQVFRNRARKILNAIQAVLWLPSKGVVAEYVDTIGNKLVHPSPELATIYLSIEGGVVDQFQAYQMFRFTKTDLRNESTLNREGRLVYSSNWFPKKYSTCGLFPAENIHLALAYFRMGAKEDGLHLLNAIVESYFAGKNPGLAGHVLTAQGVCDGGDLDFTDVSSMYLRLVVEGLYGIRFHLLEDLIEIAPGFPSDWIHANLQLKDLSLNYHRDGIHEHFVLHCEKKAQIKFKIPLRSTQIEEVLLNGMPIPHRMEAAVNHCFLIVETQATGALHLHVIHGNNPIPTITTNPLKVFADNEFVVEVSNGWIVDCLDVSCALKRVAVSDDKVTAVVKGEPGNHTLFVHVNADQFDAWLAADFLIDTKTDAEKCAVSEKSKVRNFEPWDISRYFNISLTEIHTQEYRKPRPKGYSIGMRLNGRYAWDWNQGGHNAVKVDDNALRLSKGVFRSPSGIRFSTPAKGPNVACVSMWDNFPSKISIPLKGKGRELAVFFVGITNPMQSRVENARFTIVYGDGTKRSRPLVHPENFDDWLNAALQTENETVYFSDYNHGIVQRIKLDPKKELAELLVEAIANEVILGILGISVRWGK